MMRNPNFLVSWLLCIAMLIGACASTGRPATDTEGPRVDAVDSAIWFEAAEQGNAPLIRTLLEDGVDPLIERGGLTALHIAAREGHYDAAELVLEAGVDVNLGPDEDEAMIASAAAHGSPGMLELMTGRKLEPDQVASVLSIRTPLNLAVEGGHTDMASLLLEHGADVDLGGEWYSPLHTAVTIGDIELVELLLENDARVNEMVRVQDRSQFAGFRYVTPLELATIIQRDDIASLLRKYGAR